jgi:hypothetical protein
MKNQLIQTTKTIILALILTLGMSYVMAWTGPTSTPPDGNTPTPVNVGTTDQVKNGGLGLDALSVFGTGYFSGNVGIGDTTPSNAIDINTTSTASGISFDGETAISGFSGNEWLRLNGNNHYTNGVYTPGVLRADTDMRSAKYCDINGANCKTTAQMGGTETDPQVGTLTNGKWCTSNGTTVNCTSNAPTLNSYNDLPTGVTTGFCSVRFVYNYESPYYDRLAIPISPAYILPTTGDCACSSGFTRGVVYSVKTSDSPLVTSTIYTCIKN